MSATGTTKKPKKRRQRGTGSIDKKGRVYYAIYRLPGRKSPKWERAGLTHKDAADLLKIRMGEIAAGKEATGSTPFAVYAREVWLPWFKSQKRRRSTVQDAEAILTNHLVPSFGMTPIEQIKPQHLRKYIQAKLKGTAPIAAQEEAVAKFKPVKAQLAPNTVKNHINLLSNIFKLALEDERIAANPCALVARPQRDDDEEDELKVLTREQVEQLVAAMPKRWRTLTALLAFSGLRIGEACGLRKQDLLIAENKLHVRRAISRGKDGPPKTKRAKRKVPVPSWLMGALVEQAQQTPASCKWVFASSPEAARFVDADNYRSRVFAPACETAGLDGITPHSLRHTYAARLIARKDAMGNSDSVNPKLLSYLMGHATVGFTLEVYGGLYPEDISGGVLDEGDAIAL